MIRGTFATLALVTSAVLAGCAAPTTATGSSGDPGAGGVAGMCVEGATDCVDTPQLTGDPMPIDETGIRQFRRDAKFYLGKPESELPEMIRVARVDDESYALTDDYQIGRITVELDDRGDGPVVTKSTVELPDGPETFTLKE
jgi:hypothetical protein